MKPIYLKTLCATALVTLSLVGATQAASKPSASPATSMKEQGKLDRHDHSFLKKAATLNLTEIQLGKMAEQRSSDPNIKKMGTNLVKDHEEANRNLERLAASKGVTLPSEPSLWERRSIRSLEKEQGDKFNKEFLSLNVKGHEKAVSLFEKEASRTQDPDIKAWAQKMIPALKGHKAMAQTGKPEAVAEKHQQMQQQPQQHQQLQSQQQMQQHQQMQHQQPQSQQQQKKQNTPGF